MRPSPDCPPDGHNIHLYKHPANRKGSMNADFGVEVTRSTNNFSR
jgi:hypothetical protein